MVMQWTVNPPPLARLVRSQYTPPLNTLLGNVMSFENHNTKQIDYEYRKRDLSEKYSYAVSRLGTVSEDKKQYWRDQLEDVNRRVAALNAEYSK